MWKTKDGIVWSTSREDGRLRAAYYRQLVAKEGCDPDPRGVGAAATREWSRKAALAFLGTLNHGPKR
jgi:hypothetical protein